MIYVTSFILDMASLYMYDLNSGVNDSLSVSDCRAATKMATRTWVLAAIFRGRSFNQREDKAIR